MGFELESLLSRRAYVVGSAVLALVLVLGAAGGFVWFRSTRPNYDPDTAAKTAAGVTVLVYTEEWGGDISTVSRSIRLEVLEGGCLGSSDGSLLVFPYGSKVLSGNGQVAVEVSGQSGEGTETVRPGDVVDVGGVMPGPIKSFGGNLAEHVPSGCRASEATSGIELGP